MTIAPKVVLDDAVAIGMRYCGYALSVRNLPAGKGRSLVGTVPSSVVSGIYTSSRNTSSEKTLICQDPKSTPVPLTDRLRGSQIVFNSEFRYDGETDGLVRFYHGPVPLTVPKAYVKAIFDKNDKPVWVNEHAQGA